MMHLIYNKKVYYFDRGSYLVNLYDLYSLKSRLKYKIFSGRDDLGYWLMIK